MCFMLIFFFSFTHLNLTGLLMGFFISLLFHIYRARILESGEMFIWKSCLFKIEIRDGEVNNTYIVKTLKLIPPNFEKNNFVKLKIKFLSPHCWKSFNTYMNPWFDFGRSLLCTVLLQVIKLSSWFVLLHICSKVNWYPRQTDRQTDRIFYKVPHTNTHLSHIAVCYKFHIHIHVYIYKYNIAHINEYTYKVLVSSHYWLRRQKIVHIYKKKTVHKHVYP